MTNFDLSKLVLKTGPHSYSSDYCAMEAVSALAGERKSAQPACTDRVLGGAVVGANDGFYHDDVERTDLLLPFVPRMLGTVVGPDAMAERKHVVLRTVARVFGVHTTAPNTGYDIDLAAVLARLGNNGRLAFSAGVFDVSKGLVAEGCGVISYSMFLLAAASSVRPGLKSEIARTLEEMLAIHD